jgi:uncharacterized protein
MKLDILSVATPRAYPPRVSEFTRRFWNALAEGQFITTQCRSCDKFSFPPKLICPHCWSADVVWNELRGSGRLYSWTRIHAAPAVFAVEAPYAVGIVDLDQGVRLACRLVTHERARPVVGGRVEMVVLAYHDGPLLATRPI